jgi:hypothetical protein
MIPELRTLANSLYGLKRSLEGLRREARTVAHAVADGNGADLTGTAVRSGQERRAAEANAAALRRSNDALGSRIDIRV